MPAAIDSCPGVVIFPKFPMSEQQESKHPRIDAFGIRPPDAYAIELTETDGLAVLTLEGELDLASAPVLRARLEAAAAARGAVLDMAEVTFVDSSALRELLRAARHFADADRPFVLAGVQPPVVRLLELTQTTGAFAHAGTVAQALERAGASA